MTSVQEEDRKKLNSTAIGCAAKNHFGQDDLTMRCEFRRGVPAWPVQWLVASSIEFPANEHQPQVSHHALK